MTPSPGPDPDGYRGLKAGSVIDGNYKLTRMLGQGGMATVFEAVQVRLDRRVAVKVMAKELTASVEALARFKREVEVTARLAHPHVVQVLDFGTLPTGEPYLVMEHLGGEDLAHRIARARRLPIERVLQIVRQVGSALSAAHAQAVIHRDLKPDNVFLLDCEGLTDFVKVVDFGISKVRTAKEKLTRASVLIGTPEYMAPEQATGRVDDIDHRTDQWALACISWCMLTGKPPFVEKDIPKLLYQITHEEPAPLGRDDVPKAVEEVLLKALSKRQKDRYPTISGFLRALETAVTGVPVPPSREVEAVPAAAFAPAPAAPRRMGAWIAVGVAFGLAFTGAAAFWKLRSDPATLREPPAEREPAPAPKPKPATKRGR